MAYGYATDLQRTFFAQFEVMGNLEKDLCVKRDCWTLCSRMSIEDQLYGLAFVAEDCDDVCMRVSCARKWSEVEDALYDRRDGIIAELLQQGYRIIIGDDSRENADEHEKLTKSQVSEANLVINLLGKFAGRKIKDDPETIFKNK